MKRRTGWERGVMMERRIAIEQDEYEREYMGNLWKIINIRMMKRWMDGFQEMNERKI